MERTIALIRGDGIGPEIMDQALLALDAVAAKFGHHFTYREAPMGGAAIDAFGVPLPESSLKTCLESDSTLLSAIGGPKWDTIDPAIRPEKGLLALRAGMGLYANLRPARLIPQLRQASPLRSDIVDRGIDFMVVRELIGGAYFGEHHTWEENGEACASDLMAYREHEIRRILRVGFQTAMKRNKRLCSVDKANVLDSSKLWRKLVNETAADYPEVEVRHMYVDNCAMQIVRDPSQFDVIVTENLFGDILSDEASQITGSIGMIPSSSMGDGTRGLYEPIHGSAPDIAGKDIANPIGMILAAAMMLRYSLDMPKEAEAMEQAVSAALEAGLRTADIVEPGQTAVGCVAMGRAIAERI